MKDNKNNIKAVEEFKNKALIKFMAPELISFFKDKVFFNNLFFKCNAIIKYPNKVKKGYLKNILKIENNIFKFNLTQINKGSYLPKLHNRVDNLRGSLKFIKKNREYTELENELISAEALVKQINETEEPLINLTILVSSFAETENRLADTNTRTINKIAMEDIKAVNLLFEQEKGLLSVSPYQFIDENIKNDRERNMTLSSFFWGLPFAKSGLTFPNGLWIGKDSDGGEVILDYWFRGGEFTNGNKIVLGNMGGGKSVDVKSDIFSDFEKGVKIICIDPSREYIDLALKCNGEILSLGSSNGGRINFLEPIDLTKSNSNNETDFIDLEEGEKYFKTHETNPFALFLLTIRGIFRKLFSLEEIEYSILENVLLEMYQNFGINFESNLSEIDSKKCPILEDLYNLINLKYKELLVNSSEVKKAEEIKTEEIYHKLLVMMKTYVFGADKYFFNGHTNLKSNNDFICFDIQNLENADEKTKRIMYFLMLNWSWNKISKDKETKYLLSIDEGHNLIDPEMKEPLIMLKRISKQIRKFEGRMIFITQEVVDMLDPRIRREAQGILTMATYKSFYHLESQNLIEVEKLYRLSRLEVEHILSAKQGESLMIVGNKKLKVMRDYPMYQREIFGKGGGRGGEKVVNL